jgi:hypothetical protein
MQIYRPTFQYLRVFLICTVVALVIGLLFKGNKLLGVLVVYGLGLAYISPSLIVNPRIEVSEDGTLTYYLLRSKRAVNLTALTNCSYHLQTGVRSIPMMVFHIYDANGGNATFPANEWSDRQKLYACLASAVTAKHVTVNYKTAKKLGLNLVQKNRVTS